MPFCCFDASSAQLTTCCSYVNEPMVMEVSAFLSAYFTLDPRLMRVFRCLWLWSNNRRISSCVCCPSHLRSNFPSVFTSLTLVFCSNVTAGGLSFEALFVMMMYALFRRNFSVIGKRCSIHPNLLKRKEFNSRAPR